LRISLFLSKSLRTVLQENYNWERLWCPPDSRIHYTDDGYLWEPGFTNKDVVTLDSLADVPCLVLLGEPGMGKSRTMSAEYAAVDARVKAPGEKTLWFDLRSSSSEDRLVRRIFQHPDFVNWQEGSGRLNLFLDSLDEGLLRIETLSSALAEEFLKCDPKRLMVRIACRSADWQSLLEAALRATWGTESVRLFEITPLRQRDVEEAARAEGINVNSFLEQISMRGVGPLAAKPITLQHLLRIYLEHGEFPKTQWELYEQGCGLLCDELNQSYAETRLREEFSAEQRMRVAGRIAALTMFGNRSAIWRGNNPKETTAEDLTYQELRGGYESVDPSQFSIGNFEIRESLNTGLFSLRGTHRLGWAHQTYAEFLTAWYLTQHELTPTQIMSLLIHPGDSAGKLVPQLKEVAAWLSSVNQDVRRSIARMEPDVLLQSDIGNISDSERAELVGELLALYDEERDYIRDWSIYRRLKKLNHPDLGNQLRPFIIDSNKKFLVRHIAIELAEACSLSELQSELANIALDPSEQIDLRSYAAAAVTEIGDDETRARLKPLAIDDGDIQERLKGWALKALWPRLMSASELFPLITAPAEGYAGSYTSFLSSDFLKDVECTDLPIALGWVEQQQDGQHLDYYLQRIVDRIMLTAWGQLTAPGILNSFARAAFSRLRRYTPIVAERSESWDGSTPSPAKQFDSMLTEEASKRRGLIEELLSLITEPNQLVHFIHHLTNVLRTGDLSWMIERVHTSPSEEVKVKWSKLIRASYNPYDPDDLSLVILGCQGCRELASEIVWDIRPVMLDSDEARQMRSNYELMHRTRDPEERPAIDPPIADRIKARLEDCEGGDSDAWWRLNLLMKYEPDGTTTIRDSQSDLKVMPGWINADLSTRNRIVGAAKGFIASQHDSRDEWLGKNIIFHPAFAGYRALRLVREEDPLYFAGSDSGMWQRWAAIITCFPNDHVEAVQVTETDLYLMGQAYSNASDEVIAALSVMIDKQNESEGFFEMPGKIDTCMDDRLGGAILEKARNNEIKPGTFRALISEVIKYGLPGAREFAESLLLLPLPADGVSREKALRIVSVLLEHSFYLSWPLIWFAIQADEAFCREIMERNASILRPENAFRWEHHLTEAQLADLYILAAKSFPRAEDPNLVGFHSVSSRELVGRWRDGLLNHLKGRGTNDACVNIERIIVALPYYEFLKWELIDAQDLARRNTWHGVETKHLFRLLNSSKTRLVQNGDQLVEVLAESLERLQQKLHDETPSVRDLWNEPKVRDDSGHLEVRYTPKEEDAFSDVVKRHLDADLRERGVIVNREVVIRRTTGQNDGERTDIHVDAVSRQPVRGEYEVIKVIIEIKGCWNSGLKKAMEAQLVNRYLNENSCHYGLYLVGWFSCPQWHNSDYRKGDTPSMDAAQARQYFADQATALTRNGVRVSSLVIDASLR
jgi:predicted NACHT family NTPase